MFGRKKSPSVKIPAKILKREAEKAAKKMLTAEKKKEKLREAREKAKNRAREKIERKKERDRQWEDFCGDGMRREIFGVIWIAIALVLTAVFFADAEFSVKISDGFQFLFGRGMWFLPILAAGFGIACFREEIFFPPPRILAFLLFFVATLGILNQFLPLAESSALAHKFGGVVGFTAGFFPREFLGDVAAIVILVGIACASAVPAFGIRISQLFSKKTEKISVKKNVGEGISTKKSEEKSGTERHFKNELEIVDSTGKKHEKTTEIPLEKKDELTEAKNRDFSKKWDPPDLEILKKNDATIVVDEKLLREKADAIREKLEQFGIDVVMKSVHIGPTVTQFTLEPAPGVKLAKITSLKNDLALTLAAQNVRIEAPIRGKSLVGIEIPNKDRALVGMREILESSAWSDKKTPLGLAMGRDVSGKPVVVDLAKMPHLLIAGKTGSGKSVAMNAFLTSLLWQNSPENLRMILVDPKRVELKPYDHLPHLLTPVIVEPEKCVSALAWAVAEMNRRYRMLSDSGVRNILEYNSKFPDKKEPFIVIVIDELADLMMVADCS